MGGPVSNPFSTSESLDVWIALARGNGQCEIKGRAPIRSSLRPNSSTMPSYDVLNDHQPHADTRNCPILLQSDKFLKQIRRGVQIESNPVVTNKNDMLVRIGLDSNLDHRFRRFAGVLERIAQQIHEYLS